jgi:DNA-binding MurR/RpiR family transcriptional regulator
MPWTGPKDSTFRQHENTSSSPGDDERPVTVRVVPRSKQDSDSTCSTNAAVVLNRETLQSMFHMRLPEAAKRLGVSETTLKQVCRKLGVPRWPRQLKYPTRSNARGGAITKAGTHFADSPRSAAYSEESSVDDDDKLTAASNKTRKRSAEATGPETGSSARPYLLPFHQSITVQKKHQPPSMGPERTHQMQLCGATSNLSTLPIFQASSLSTHTRLAAQFESELASIISFPPLSDLLRTDGAGRDSCRVGARGINPKSALHLGPKDSTFRQHEKTSSSPGDDERPVIVRVVPRSMQGGLRNNVAVELNRKKLESMFHMRLPEAAKHLCVSETTLKHVCRKLGVSRWPRQLKYSAPSNESLNARACTTTKAETCCADSPLSVSYSEELNMDDTRNSIEAHTTSQTRKNYNNTKSDFLYDPFKSEIYLNQRFKSELAAVIAFPALSDLLEGT